MIDCCRQWYLALLPYEGTALNLIDILSAVLDLRRKPYSGMQYTFKNNLGKVEELRIYLGYRRKL